MILPKDLLFQTPYNDKYRAKGSFVNFDEVKELIQYCCQTMKEYILCQPIKTRHDGLAFDPATPKQSAPSIQLSGEGQYYGKIEYCPFCAEKISVACEYVIPPNKEYTLHIPYDDYYHRPAVVQKWRVENHRRLVFVSEEEEKQEK